MSPKDPPAVKPDLAGNGKRNFINHLFSRWLFICFLCFLCSFSLFVFVARERVLFALLALGFVTRSRCSCSFAPAFFVHVFSFLSIVPARSSFCVYVFAVVSCFPLVSAAGGTLGNPLLSAAGGIPWDLLLPTAGGIPWA